MSRPQPRRDAGPSARQAPRRRASASEAPVNAGPAAHRPPDLVELGVITGAHALRGEVRVQWYGDGPENLARVAEVWLARDPADPAPRHFEVRACGSGRAGDVRLALRGVSDRESAEALRGETVLGLAASLAPLPEGEFYWHELVGCDVVDRRGARSASSRSCGRPARTTCSSSRDGTAHGTCCRPRAS